jgi:hypothetical protein
MRSPPDLAALLEKSHRLEFCRADSTLAEGWSQPFSTGMNACGSPSDVSRNSRNYPPLNSAFPSADITLA